ncbi:MAG: cellobiose phosphorylase [Candidatus Omnitrophica bacterium]|nr:cellobiose phosphorylase [Candidatus Omnitrophota bacterium]
MPNRKKSQYYRFIDSAGTFQIDNPYQYSYCYFPLTNQYGTMLSAISPYLSGDIKQDNDHFLTLPTSIEDIPHNLLCRRDFFIKMADTHNEVYRLSEPLSDKDYLQAGLLYHTLVKQNRSLRVEIVNFVPHELNAEVMSIKIKNISKKPVTLECTSCIPLYGRGEKNVRDHRHVSSLLNRIDLAAYGIILTPTMVFDEGGHQKNETCYYVYGFGNNRSKPQGFFPTLSGFCGEGNSLIKPDAIFKKTKPSLKPEDRFNGKEACAGIRFSPVTLAPKKEAEFALVMGIAPDRYDIAKTWRKLDSPRKISRALDATKKFWLTQDDSLTFDFGDPVYNNWLRWIKLQPTLRKLFGCSFLPHFDYGKGGRGFRDLWQDILSLILKDESGIEGLILDNFKSIRIDGSNATIITQDGRFLPDRNKISRVWTDHGIWPILSTCLFLNRSGKIELLLKKTSYFRDSQLNRSRQTDCEFDQTEPVLMTTGNRVYQGTVIEHLLIENLTQFFNVGAHNILRLENGDWNDGLDMAPDKGECVPFYCMYAHNLLLLCGFLEKLKVKTEKISLLKEIAPLLDRTFHGTRVDYKNAAAKKRILDDYMEKTNRRVSGEQIHIPIDRILEDLNAKAEWIIKSLRKKEWLKDGFFNGYYDNKGARVEGTAKKQTRMLLQSQVFPIMAGVATDMQIATLWDSINRHLKDKEFGGYRLNTDFQDIYPELGRAFGFSYGDKENGAFFNHMVVLLSYAFYRRNFITAADKVFSSLYEMARNPQAAMYPQLPEYFNRQGRGLYWYLTGSASWYIYTLFEQILGIGYQEGNLVIRPQLTAHNFSEHNDTIKIKFRLHGRTIHIEYKKSGHRTIYALGRIVCAGKPVKLKAGMYSIKKETILAVPPGKGLDITVELK